MISTGDRVYHRKSDLFGRVVSINGSNATVRYEWPWDPKAQYPDSSLEDWQ
jgi:hypothetical protein